ncbi:hypothetical protein AMK23_33790 [Streptomyces sp. CB02130]|nr:hypothetical protein AMK23_33790 [Streptomyces sp. CB02130]
MQADRRHLDVVLDGQEFTSAGSLDIDHMVALADAGDSGVSGPDCQCRLVPSNYHTVSQS